MSKWFLFIEIFFSLSLLRLGSVVGPELKDCSRLFAMQPFATAHTWNKNGIESIDRSLNIYIGITIPETGITLWLATIYCVLTFNRTV